ncbi:hypothetical protein F5Y15DRAFT_399923 [Xylariaceae sp. FL0016]|nr:hypothetical protein F5Y15DRAFT_399923 [Xylariaceae sp. FL0016]
MPSHASRPFSTTSQVYPAYLPALHKSRRVEKKLVTATVAAVGIGYGLAKYRQGQLEQQQQQQQPYYHTTAEASAAAAAARQRADNNSMMDAYGDRSSLAELEAAVKAYEMQRK